MRPIEVLPIGKAGAGYRVLASWRKPGGPASSKKIDLWIPELAPSIGLAASYRKRRIGWKEYSERYRWELRTPWSQDFLRPLALLSLRKKLVLLCGCENEGPCPDRILAEVLSECRRKRDFRVGTHPHAPKGGLPWTSSTC